MNNLPENIGFKPAGTATRLEEMAAVTAWLQRSLDEYRVGGRPRVADISALSHHDRTRIDQLLGEGEVSLIYRDDQRQVQIQESVLPGIWRSLQHEPGGNILCDRIEICAIPELARRVPDPAHAARLKPAGTAEGVVNALPILSELEEQTGRWRQGAPAYAINLTLLPMSAADLAFLEQTLGRGPVETLFRGHGDCRVISTACPGIWWVRYTNAMGRLILNTLEVTDIPVVLCAAAEDLEDSRRRLPDLLEELPGLTSLPAAEEPAA